MDVVYLEFIEGDLAAGREFYDSLEFGVGEYFVDSIMADADSLALFAGIHGKRFGFHRLLGKTFPFAVYYLLDSGQARVYAILDMRRDPTWIRAELGTRS